MRCGKPLLAEVPWEMMCVVVLFRKWERQKGESCSYLYLPCGIGKPCRLRVWVCEVWDLFRPTYRSAEHDLDDTKAMGVMSHFAMCSYVSYAHYEVLFNSLGFV